MNFEPQKFFIGLVDFFSILLPGALLTYVIKNADGSILGGLIESPKEGAGWIAFLLLSYIMGHFIFFISAVFDDIMFDPLKKRTREGQIRQLADGDVLAWKITRGIAFLCFPKGIGSSERHAEILHDHYLNKLGAKKTMNIFQWCKNRLSLEKPETIAIIQRFEADSKFFRSLLILLIIFLILGILVACGTIGKHNQDNLNLGISIAFTCFFLWLLAFWRYAEQRVKAIKQAYGLVITLEAQKEEGFRFKTPNPNKEATHAGGVVFRQKSDQVEYLLVGAKKKPDEWVLPKGHIEQGERMQETAVREVHEETGVWARIINELKSIPFIVNNEPVNVQFYLMEALEEGESSEKRKCEWMTLEVAREKIIHKDITELLEKVDRQFSAHGVKN